MGSYPAQFTDDSGEVRLSGAITFTVDEPGPGGTAGGSLTGTYPDPGIANGAVAAAQLATAAVTDVKISPGNVTLDKLAPTFPYLLVQSGAPTVFTSPLVFDSTAVTGGLYGWDGTAYQQIGDPL